MVKAGVYMFIGGIATLGALHVYLVYRWTKDSWF